MKLKDYFKAQNNYKLSTNDKFLMYEKILMKQQKKNSPVQRFFSIKSFAYWFMSVILIIWIYWFYLFQNDISYDDFIIQDSNTVNADYIAKVVDFDGTFYVAHDNKIYKTTKIQNWDSVVLKKWAEILFTINSGTKAKLSGPARFTLSQNSGTYQLILAEWDYIQMESTNTWWEAMEIILSDDIKISSTQNLDILITKDNSEYKINNQWDKIHVTANRKTKEVAPQQLLAINENDITLIENVEDFKVAFTNQSVNQTFKIQEWEKEANEITSALSEITSNTQKSNTTSSENLDAIAQELWVLDDQKIPTQDQLTQLYSTLDKNSLLWTLESLYKDWISGDEKDYNFYKNNLNTKIQNLYKAFDIKSPKSDLLSDIANLKSVLGSTYHIPSTQLDKLSTLANWITYIQNQKLWSITDENLVDESWTKLINNLPSNLILN